MLKLILGEIAVRTIIKFNATNNSIIFKKYKIYDCVVFSHMIRSYLTNFSFKKIGIKFLIEYKTLKYLLNLNIVFKKIITTDFVVPQVELL